MKNPELFSENGSKEDLTILFLRYNCSVMEIQDVIEDSESGSELTAKLNKLKLFSRFTLDRETPEYVRLKTTDCFENTYYLKAYK
ncbi:MAG: hypothetical protein IJQ56_05425 [Synergistaceae bacterium]|nr:hypothetical protein [Synergistaceae bacterium]MBR0203791.1 hypothetical protein [Synergistaceae bacterium]